MGAGDTGLERIRELLKLMEAHGLIELEVESEGTKVRLVKSHPVAPSHGLHGESHPAPAAGTPEGAVEEGEDEYTIVSPIVGTFYTAPSPDAEPFVEPGDPVDADAVVCIVEAMKVMNEVKAEVPGTIRRVLVESGKPVEYGQPLFLVSR